MATPVIELVKGPSPTWISTNQGPATAAYIGAAVHHKPSPWKRSEIVDALKIECNHKCMYCEGFIDDVAYAAVEHIRPKSTHPELVLEWTNLGIACQRCNTNKGDYWTDLAELQLLNPYVDRVADHLQFVGPIVVSAGGSSRGVNTVRVLKFFDREDLLVSKMKRIEDLDLRIRLWRRESNEEVKILLAEDIQDAIGPGREFSASLVAFASLQGFDASTL